MTTSRKQALIIFAKRPVPGQVKTRLAPPLTPHEAARLYECMLRDIISRTARLAGLDRIIFYTDEPGALAYFRQLAPEVPSFPQQGAGLGERMANAFLAAFSQGYREVAIIGSDSPDLPLVCIEDAFTRLAGGDTDAVFGPSEDGGYYLIALRRMHDELFREITWSRSDVLSTSLARAAEAGIRVGLLPGWYDVDTIEDLQRPELRDGANDAPLTREFIESRLGARSTGLQEEHY